jgi:hypothetical protein
MLRAAIGSLGFALSLALVAPAGAWEGEMAGLVKAIAEVKSTAESGDFVVIEGRVADVQSGNGSLVIVIFEDDSGSLPMAVPNHLQRHFAGGGPAGGSGPSGADPQIGRRARVGGRWDRAYIDGANATWAVRVQRVERLED